MQIVDPQFTEEVFELFRRYQSTVHGEVYEEIMPRSLQSFLIESPLKVPLPLIMIHNVYVLLYTLMSSM